MWRELFSYSINPEVFLDVGNLWSLVHTDQDRGLEVAALRQESVARWSDLATRLSVEQRRKAARFVLEQSAPVAATLGATLHSLSAPGVFELPEQLRAMALLADDVGAGAASCARADAFRAIARRHGIEAAAAPPHELAQDRRINDSLFRLPGAILALSRRSDAFGAVLIGADMAQRELGCLPCWSFAAEVLSAPEWERLDMAIPQTADSLPAGETPLGLARALADALADTPDQQAQCATGIALYLALIDEWDWTLFDLTLTHLDPRLSMGLLLQAKAREASVYHENFKIEGQSLRDWLSKARKDPLPLLEVLGRSRIIRKGDPDKSRFATQMLDYGGPMFRVFNDGEIAIIRDWITDLGQDDSWPHPDSRGAVLARLAATFVAPRSEIGQGDATLGVTPTGIRQAYFTLQGRALAPATRAFAAEYCEFWLAKARKCIDATDRSLPVDWQPGLLREWLLDTHDHHAARFEQSAETEIPSREAVIEQSVQLAPLTLIDGAWLQGFTDIALASSRVGAPLFKTYWDELGNGAWDMNHPKVYRDVLSAMGKELPPTGSLEFAHHPDLRDDSFQLPVYWLAIGKFPSSYRAEILGLNLAMELSGVGGTYRNAHRFLQHYNLPTIFVDLHNTIDNVSDGHAAWAADAIDLFISAIEDPDEVRKTWSRVRAGFESLDPIARICGNLDFFATRSKAPGKPVSAADALHHVPPRMSA